MRSAGFLRRCQLLVIASVTAALSLAVGMPSSVAHAAASHTWQVTVGVQTANGAISGMAFTPSQIYVKAGDTIVWTVGSKEIHTVTFGNPPANTDNEGAEGITNPLLNAFEEIEEQFATPAGGTSFDGVSNYSSGIMTTTPAASGFPQAKQHYSLTIDAPVGTYTFYCLVHGPMMSQVVHVIPSDQAYPFTQAQYDAQAAQQRGHIFAQGWQAYAKTVAGLAPNTVSVGASVDAGQADVMRFLRPNTTIKVNGSVTFINKTFDPHTVTIGAEQGILAYGDTNNVRQGDNVSSGVFGAAFTGFGLPGSVTFRFTQPGVYHYYCVFHDYMGMVGTITVTP
ncbi:MAG TPA: plastocyanin/azurin family copper-binding protein [Ktedonobacterales bacterium]